MFGGDVCVLLFVFLKVVFTDTEMFKAFGCGHFLLVNTGMVVIVDQVCFL